MAWAWRQAALGLLNELLRGGFAGVGGGNVRRAGLGRGQCLIVDLLRHLALVDEQLVAAKIILRFHIVRFGRFDLGMSGGQLPLGRDDSSIRVFNTRGGESKLA